MTTPTYALYLTEPGDSSAIDVKDINQEKLGDCFFLSAVGELALYDPSVISNMIKDDGNDTYTINLYANSQGQQPGLGTPNYTIVSETVTVSGIASDSVNAYTTEDVVNGQKEIWPQILEEAYAQANGGYSVIGTGGIPYVPMEELTGRPATAIFSPTAGEITATMLTQDRNAGNIIEFDTPASNNSDGLVGAHAYMYAGLETINGVVCIELDNPWGQYDEPAPIPLSHISADFDEIDIGQTGAPILATPATSTIDINVSEDAYNGNAQFTVSVDGQIIKANGVAEIFTATAAHSTGGSQEIALPGTYLVGQQHVVAVDFLNDAWGGSAAKDRNLYVNSITYNGTNTAENSELTSDGTKNFSLGYNESISLSMSENAYQGDAQFIISVDGNQLENDYTVMAAHSAGATQTITLPGLYSMDQHAIAITFLNPATGVTPQTSRNLYVNSISYAGVTTAENAELTSNAPQDFTVGQAIYQPITLNMSEDYYLGNAQFTVSINGVTVVSGGSPRPGDPPTTEVFTVTASHSAGATQSIVLPQPYAINEVENVSIDFINDAYGGSSTKDRNLYVNSLSFAGTTIIENTELKNNGAKSFAISSSILAELSSEGADLSSQNSNIPAQNIASAISSGPDIETLAKNAAVTYAGGDASYRFLSGDGSVSIDQNLTANKPGSEHIEFAGNVTENNLWFTKSGKDLVVNVLGTKDQVTLGNFYKGSSAPAAEFSAGNLTVDAQVSNLIQAMASFSGSHAGFNPATTSQTTLASEYFGSSLAITAGGLWHS